MNALTIAIAVLLSFGIMEIVLRSFPSLIGITVLSRFEPQLRAEIAKRLGLPTIESAFRITPEMRSDGGPTIFLPEPGSITVVYADAVDIALGAVEHVVVDKNGLCNDPRKAEEARADVIVAGDSFTFCTAVTAVDTAAHRLQELSGLRTYNLGVKGTGPDEYIEIIKRHAPTLRPRVAVINFYEGNDLRDIYRKRQFLEDGKDPRATKSSHRKHIVLEPAAWSYAAELLEKGVGLAVKLAKRRIQDDEDTNFRYAATVGDKSLAMNITNHDTDEVDYAFKLRNGDASLHLLEDPFRRFVNWAREHAIVPIVAYVPSMYTAYGASVRFQDPTVGSAVQAFSSAQRRWFSAQADSIGYRYLDLVPAFQRAASEGVITHFPANVHLTPQGHEVVAGELHKLLQELKLGSPSDM